MAGAIEVIGAGFADGVVGGFTTRRGGVSETSWAELNLALHVADDEDRVVANRAALARQLGASPVRFPDQVHGAEVWVIAGDSVASPVGHVGSDAVVTATAQQPIGVLVADCLPVLIADAAHGVVGVAHAGRRGLAAGVLQNTLRSMTTLGAQPDSCVAVVGPGVCGGCYEVPVALRDEIDAVVPGSASTTHSGTPSLDLAAGAGYVLRDAGVGEVRVMGICTMEDSRFYSFRREGVTGRFAGVVMLASRD